MNSSSKASAFGPFDSRRAVLTAAPFLVACAATAVSFVALQGRLPDTLATHFDGARADGFLSRGAFLAAVLGTMIGMGVLFSALAGAMRAPRGAHRTMVGAGFGTAALLCCACLAVLFGNADATDAAEVTSPAWQLIASLGAALLAGALGAWLAGPDRGSAEERERPAPRPRLALKEGELVSWSHPLAPRWVLPAGLALLAAGVVIGVLTYWVATIAVFVLGAFLALFGAARVVADRRGLSIALPGLPVPLTRVGLQRIAEASCRDTAPRHDLGGWGYRVLPGRSGFALRSGPGIWLRLVSGREFVVVVDDAWTAAGLLNTLADRSRERA